MDGISVALCRFVMDMNNNNCIGKGSPRHIPQSKFPHSHCYAPGYLILVYTRNVIQRYTNITNYLPSPN